MEKFMKKAKDALEAWSREEIPGRRPFFATTAVFLVALLLGSALLVVAHKDYNKPADQFSLQTKDVITLWNKNVVLGMAVGKVQQEGSQDPHELYFFPSTPQIVGFIIAALGLMIAAGVGVGGGGILVPVYIITLHLPSKLAVPLSNITIFGGALANFLIISQKRHPNTKVNRPLIDYDAALIMEPTTIIGSILGATLNKLLPSYVVSVMLVVMLLVTSMRTLRKWKKIRHEEESQMPLQQSEQMAIVKKSEKIPISSDESLAVAIPPSIDSDKQHEYGTFEDRNLKNEMELQQMIYFESRVPWRKILLLLVIEVGVVYLRASPPVSYLYRYCTANGIISDVLIGCSISLE